MSLALRPFAEAVEDVSRGSAKIPQSEFEPHGSIPIVDQGRALIAGYTDDRNLICKVPAPAIVFGDHTRALKYVDFSFAIGADGVKVLRVKAGWDPKYVYHYLVSCQIPSAGYSRHFKFLKELRIPQPPLDEQRRVAAILDQADVLRAKRRQTLAQLDDLTQSIFLDMFGDPVENPLGLPTRALSEWVTPDSPITYGILKPGDDLPDGVPYIRVVDIRDGAILTARVRRTSGEIAAAYERSKVAAGDLVISIRGHVGRIGMVPSELQDANITQDSARIRLPSEVRDYVRAALETDSMAHWMARRTKGAAVRGLNLGDLRLAPVPVPPESEVREFSKSADHVRTQRRFAVMQGECAQQMFASLQSRAFSGQL